MAPRFTVIEGGVPDGAPRPVVWNRTPDKPHTLLILDSGEPWEPITLAYDDGRPFLVGIRNVRLPADAAAFQGWQDGARADGLQVVDQRGCPAALTDGATAQRQLIELELRRRAAKRDCDPLPAGGLFDEVRRATQELF